MTHAATALVVIVALCGEVYALILAGILGLITNLNIEEPEE